MKRVVLTGATGFVGANLCRRLLEEGHEVHCLVRPHHKSWRLSDIQAHLQMRVVELADHAGLAALLSQIRPDWVFHLAAYGAYSWQQDLTPAIQVNLLNTINLVEACRQVGFEALVTTGSSSEYGFKAFPAAEDDPLDPNSYYAVAKAGATMFCRYTAQRFHLPIHILRLYSVYGPYEEPRRLIPSVIVNALRGTLPPLVSAEVARDFVFAQDVNDAYLTVAASASDLPFGSIFNVGSGKQTTIRELVTLTRSLFAIPEEPRWGSMENRSWDTNTWVADNSRLLSAGWSPKHSFRAGYIETIDWFKHNPSLVTHFYT